MNNKDSFYQIVLENTKKIRIDTSDLFAWGDNSSMEIETEHLEQVKDIIEKYQDKGLYAYLSHIKNRHVMPFYRNEQYEQAYSEIKKLMQCYAPLTIS